MAAPSLAHRLLCLAFVRSNGSPTLRRPCPCRLDEVGYGVGLRLLEVLCYRERGQRRETRLLDMLKFIHRWEHPAGCRGSCGTPTRAKLRSERISG